METLPKENQYLEDSDPNKFIAKMGAEAIYDLLVGIDLDALSYELRHKANNDSSQQRKNEALKRLQVVESFPCISWPQQTGMDDCTYCTGYSA